MRGGGLLLAALLSIPVGTAAAAGRGPVISIVIDDVGDRLAAGRTAVDLPGPVAYSFLPATPHAVELAKRAHAQGKEVLLHLPMQAEQAGPLGPGALTLHMGRLDFLHMVDADLAGIPYVVGVNNHMGSLLTRHPGHMTWLMQDLKRRGGLFFLDSRTTAKTVAERMAIENGVPALRRDVFLDDDAAPAAVEAQFDRLIALARRRGYAIAIGHPYPSTLSVLADRLPRLKAMGVELIPLQEMLRRQQAPTSVRRLSSSR